MPARLGIEGLEPKLLFSADLTSALGLEATDVALLHDASTETQTTLMLDATVQTEHPQHSLVVVDAGLDDLETLLGELRTHAGDSAQIVLVQRDEDGISRLTQALAGREGLKAIHLISHGSDGEIRLGQSVLDASTLLQRAAEVAAWGQSLAEGADWLIYGCEVAATETGKALVTNLALLTGADVHASDDLTGRGGDWSLEVQHGRLDVRTLLDSTTAWSGQLAQAEPSSKGTAVWSDASTGTLKYGQWDGLTLQTIGSTQVAANWNVMTSAVSPSGQTAIAMGIDVSGNVSVQRWTGSQWEANGANPLATGLTADRQGFAVAYEQVSGQAMVVWNNGSGLSYQTHDGSDWSDVKTVSIYTGAEPSRIQLVAQPKGDGMLLTVSDANVEDRALAWNGSNWVSEQVLDTSGGPSYRQLAVNAAYESVSGLGMVFYGRSDVDGVFYRTFDGQNWSGQQTVPLTLSNGVLSISTASAANSDAIGLGVTSLAENFFNSTYQQHFLRWDGDAWSSVLNGPRTSTVGAGTVALAFEARSGDLLAAYANASNTPLLATLAAGSNSWSSAITGPDLGAPPGWLRLSSDPLSNHIMLSAQGTNGTVAYADWDGSQLNSVSQPTSNNGVSLSPGFTWFWRADPQISTGTLLLVGSSGGGPGWPGLNQVAESELLALDRTGLLLEAPNTQGTFSHHWDLAAFGASTLDDVVWVSQSVILSSGLTLQRGDLLFTVGNSSTLTSQNSISVNNNDVVMFRPVSSTDYSRGQFQKIIGTLGANGGLLGSGSAPDIRGLALVEQDTLVGDTLLKAGELLFTAGSGSTARDIHVFTPDSVGLLGALLTGTTRTLMVGSDIDLNADITALEIVSQPTVLGGRTLQQGDLLLTLGQSDSFGNNNGSVDSRDVALLRLATTSFTGGTAGNVSLLMDGSDLGLPGTPMDALAIRSDPTPEITTLGGGREGRVSVSENGVLTVTTVQATGIPGGSGVSYSIVGGADANQFTLNASTGVLSFLNTKDREAPSDADQNNVYEVEVRATDSGRSDSQLILVTVDNVNEAPELTSGSSVSVEVIEFQTSVGTLQATDPDGPSLSWRIVGGADAALFTVNGNELQFAQTPDTTATPYRGHGPLYTVELQAFDGALTSATQTWEVELKPVNRPPVNTLPSTASTDEDTELVLQGLSLNDADAGNAPIELVFSVLHGQLSLDTAVPGGITSVVVSADGRTLTLNDSVGAIQQSLLANALRYRPDANFNGSDTLTMRSDDLGSSGEAALNGITSDTDTLTLTINPVNDAPVLTAPSEISLAEGGTVVLSANDWSTSDVDNPTASLRYQLTLPPSHGRIELSTNPGVALTEFTQAQLEANTVRYVHDGSESFADTLNIQVTDPEGQASAARTLTLRINAVNDAPELTSGSSVSVEVIEFQTSVGTLQATDPDGPSLSWRIVGGADAALFTVNGNELQFAQTPDTTATPYRGHGPLYTVELQAFDGALTSATQTWEVELKPVNRPPVNTLPSTASTDEDTELVLQGLSLNDADAGNAPIELVFSVLHGQLSLDTAVPGGITSVVVSADGRTLTLNDSVGAIQQSLLANALRYRPDANFNGSDTLTMRSDDLGSSGEAALNGITSDTDTLTLTINPVNDAPVLTAPSEISLAEGGTVVLSANDWSTSDVDNPTASLRYQLTLPPSHGRIELSTNPGVALTEFTQAQLEANTVRYVHDGSESFADTLSIQVTNPQGQASAARTLTLRISAVNDAPELSPITTELGVEEGGGAALNADFWRARDAEDAPEVLRYELRQALLHGRLVWSGSSAASITQFTQAQLDAGEVRYLHDGGESTQDALTLVAIDSADLPSEPLTLTVRITLVNDAPVLSAPTSLNATEGLAVTLPASAWTLTDADDALNTLRYEVIQSGLHGRIEHIDAPGVALSAFNPADLAQGKIRYVHDGSETLEDRMLIQALDAQGARSAEQTLSLIVAPVDDIPQVVRAALQIQQGQSATPELVVLDPDTAATDITFTVQSAQSGAFVDATTLQVVQSFSLAQLQAGQVVFQHDGSANAPGATLSVSAGPHLLNDIALSVGFTPTPAPLPTSDGTLGVSIPADDGVSAPDNEPTTTTTEGNAEATSPEGGGTTAPTLFEPEAPAATGAIGDATDLQSMRLSSALGWTMPGSGLRTFTDTNVTPTGPYEPPATEASDLAPRWNGSLASAEVLDEINQRLGQLRDDLMQPESRRQTLMASSIALTTGLSVGYVIWLVRGGALLGSMLSSMPLWNMVDPLPVLNRAHRSGQGSQASEDDPSVEQLFDGPASVPTSSLHTDPAPPPAIDTPSASKGHQPHNGESRGAP